MEASKLALPFEEHQQEVSVDWSNLPAGLVVTISKKLHDLFDFVYFRAVCKKWYKATSISDLPPQIPWVLESHNNGNLRVYSLISGKTRTIRCPKSRDMCLHVPSHGYLYGKIDHRKYCLLNPLTNDEVSIKLEENFHGQLLSMSSDPMGSYDHIVFFDQSNLGFYQPSSQEWCYVQSPLEVIWSCDSQSCFRGYYIIDDDEDDSHDTVIIDIASRSSFLVPYHDDFDDSDNVFFVESAGKILRIVKQLDYDSVSSKFNFSFDIYQLDLIDKNCGYRWIRTSSIGNQILFLDDECDGISIAACETTGLRGNCIYHLQQCDDRNPYSDIEVYRYNIEDGRTEKISSRFNHSSNWFVPRIFGSLSNPY